MIDTDGLGCTARQATVYGLHDSGLAVPAIASRMGAGEGEVRLLISDVWRRDKAAGAKSRAKTRADELNGD